MISKPSSALLVAVSVLGPFTMHLIVPAITPIQQAFGIDAGTAALLISGTLWGIAGSTLFFGAFADRYGRRPMLIIGLFLFIIGSVIGYVAPTSELVIAGRVVQGIGASTGMVISRAVIRDLYERDKGTSVLAYLTMAVMIAPILAPASAGYIIETLGWRVVFEVSIALGAIVILWTIMKFPETLVDPIPMPNITALVAAYASVLQQRVFVLYTLVSTFVMTSFFSMMSGAPQVAEHTWGLARDELGYYLGIGAMGMMCSTFITARIAEHVDNNLMMQFGLMIVALGVGVSATCFWIGYNHPIFFFGPMFLNGIGAGFVLPTATTGALSIVPRMAGTASGMMTFLQFAIAGVAAQLIGYFDHSTPWAVLGFMAVSVSLAVACGQGAVSMVRRKTAAAE